MAPVKDKLDHSFVQNMINPKRKDLTEESQSIILDANTVNEWLEEQARESLRGRIHDKPRWAE